jgi:hypothetical protein
MIAFLTLGEGPYGFSLELNLIREPDCFIELVLMSKSLLIPVSGSATPDTPNNFNKFLLVI